jgi:hypothetical protein
VGTVDAVFTVTLSGSSAETVTVEFATADDTATVGNDYVDTSGTLEFLGGAVTQTITVQVNGDPDAEADETFFVDLSNAVGATIANGQGVGTIVDDDASGNPNDMYVWDIEFFTGKRGKKTVEWITVTVSRDSDSSGTANPDDIEVPGAAVTANVIDQSGSTIRTLSGNTDSLGVFEKWINPLGSGTYGAEVVSLSHDTYAWNQDLDPNPDPLYDDMDTNGNDYPEQWRIVGGAAAASRAAFEKAVSSDPVTPGWEPAPYHTGQSDLDANIVNTVIASNSVGAFDRGKSAAFSSQTESSHEEVWDKMECELLDDDLLEGLALALL